MERIAVIGPGAMGIFLAARFARANMSVFLVDYKKERAEIINRKGITVIENDNNSYSYKIPCYTEGEECEPVSKVFLSVKSYDTERALLQAMKFLSPLGTIVSFQNGIKHVELIRQYIPRKRTAFGITCQGTTIVETGKVRHCGNGETLLAEEEFNCFQVSRLAELLNKAQIETKTVKDLSFILWRKLLFNVAINGVTAVLGINNGRLPMIKEAWEIALLCFYEAREIAALSVGSEIFQVTEDDLRDICSETAENSSSMLQDVRRGKRTEIRALNGFIVEEGRRNKKKTPGNKIILKLVTALEEANR